MAHNLAGRAGRASRKVSKPDFGTAYEVDQVEHDDKVADRIYWCP